MRRLFAATSLALVFGTTLGAEAEIYKYKKPDGTVVYTDNIGQLPRDRQEYYTRIQQERDAKRREVEKAIGKEELEKREAEAKRAELERATIAEAERAERTRALDEALADIKKRRAARDAARATWQNRMKSAQQDLEKKLAEFKSVSERFSALAIQPSFALLPGQAEELEKLRAEMSKLEQEIDALVVLIEETIPEEARKAGVPPGWLR